MERKKEINLLVVDDEPLNVEFVEFSFENFTEVKVFKASNGKEGLSILQSEDIDIVLVDIMMPIMDGFTMLKRIKNHPVYRHIPVIVITSSINEKKNALRMGATDFIFKPFDPEELRLRVFNYAEIKKYNDLLKNINIIMERKVEERTKELREALTLAQEAEREIVLRLGKAAEQRDIEIGSHILRMSLYCGKLAELIGLPRDDIELITNASPLHDVGKIGIPDSILLKPSFLTPEEFEIMKKHTVIGGEILSNADKYKILKAGRIIALQHHERWDGSGYPYNLKGEEIHIFGRISAIADVFDALTTKRIYKPAFSIPKSIEIMRKESGKSFDPEILKVFLENIDKFIKIKEGYV